MQHQLYPNFILIAFTFSFEVGVRSPDLRTNSQWRGHPIEPQVDFLQFVPALVRRIEGQRVKDWIFVFVVTNLIFRSVGNLPQYMEAAGSWGP